MRNDTTTTTTGSVIRLPGAAPAQAEKARPAHKLDLTTRWDFETAIQADHDLTFAAVKAAHVLLDLYNHHTGYAWPSAETIAERIGVTRTTASAAVNQLADREWFTITADRKGNRQGSNRYAPNLDRAGFSVGPSRHSENADDASQRRLQPTLSVGSSDVSASAPADTNSLREPVEGNPPNAAVGRASPRGTPLPPSGSDRPRAVKLPDGFAFTTEDEFAAWERGCSVQQIARSLVRFREGHRGMKKMLGAWEIAGRNWLQSERPDRQASA